MAEGEGRQLAAHVFANHIQYFVCALLQATPQNERLPAPTTLPPFSLQLRHVAVVVVVLTFDCIYPSRPPQLWLTPPTV